MHSIVISIYDLNDHSEFLYSSRLGSFFNLVAVGYVGQSAAEE